MHMRTFAAPSRSRTLIVRRGAAVVEFAVVVPVLVLFVLGMIEVGRAIMVGQVLSHAARAGAREAIVESATTAKVTAEVEALLSDAGVREAGVSVLVNGAEGEVAGATTGDEVAVAISVPYAEVSWVGSPQFLRGRNLVGRCAMRHE